MYKAKQISILVGYKSELIKKELKKFKEIKLRYIKIKDYQKFGHAFTWFKYKKFWIKEKKKLLLIHTDIIFDEKILINIIKSRRKNIIGMKDKKNHKMTKGSFVIKTDSKNLINEINFLKYLKRFSGEIIGINKISRPLMENIFKFMDFNFRYKENKFLSWEQIINEYIFQERPKIYVLPKQNYNWVNINRVSDLKKVKKIFGKL